MNPQMHATKQTMRHAIDFMQDVLTTACNKADDEMGLPPKLREAIVVMMSAVPQDSDLVRDVVAAVKHVLGIACGASALPELILNLLKLPAFCQVQVVHVDHP